MVTTRSNSGFEISKGNTAAPPKLLRTLAKAGMLFCAGVITGGGFASKPQLSQYAPPPAANCDPVNASAAEFCSGGLKHREVVAGRAAASCWADLESEDYVVYARNLRAFGCPETTLQDIVAADLHAAYAGYLDNSRLPPVTNFWQSTFGKRQMDIAVEEVLRAGERLALAEILGFEPKKPTQEQNLTDSLAGGELWLEALPASRRSEVNGIWHELKEEQQSLAAKIDAGTQTQDELNRYIDIDQEQSDRMAALLSPEEFETFELHNSVTASGLRNSLEHIELSEAEFRVIFRLSKEYEQITAEASNAEGYDLMGTWRTYLAGVQEVLGLERYSRFAQNKGLEPAELANELAVTPTPQNSDYSSGL